MAPGPAMSGIASGKAAMLRARSSTACSAASPSRRMRTPNTISVAIENNKRPPAMRKAESEIDKGGKQPIADQRGADEDRRGDQRRAQRHLAAQRLGKALGDADEGRRQSDRIDDDQQRHQRRDEKVQHCKTGPNIVFRNKHRHLHRCFHEDLPARMAAPPPWRAAHKFRLYRSLTIEGEFGGNRTLPGLRRYDFLQNFFEPPRRLVPLLPSV